MTGSEFFRTYASRPFTDWERAIVELGRTGGLAPWPMVPVTITGPDGTAITFDVASDYLAVGTTEDALRMPLLPKTAQTIANDRGMLLPTPRLVYETWRQAPIKLTPQPLYPNRGANLAQYAEHSAAIDAQLAALGHPLPASAGVLKSGHKKDIVVSSLLKPGKVVIFGWYQPNAGDVFDNGKAMQDPARQPIQPHSDAHGDFYVDYSHGVRLVGPYATVNGRRMRTEDVYTDPVLGKIASHDGPIKVARYDAPNRPNIAPPSPPDAARVALVDLGLQTLLELRGIAA